MPARVSFIIGVSILGSLALFIASLKMTALVLKDAAPVTGLQTLLLGWFGVLCFQFPWFANPAYFAALVLAVCKSFGAAQILALIAIALGALSFLVPSWYPDESKSVPVLRVGAAFYFWMASFIVLLGGVSVAKMVG